MIILLNTYQVKITIFVLFFVSYKCTNSNVSISTMTTAGDDPQRVFRTLFERANVYKMKAGENGSRNRKYHKTYVLLGVQ